MKKLLTIASILLCLAVPARAAENVQTAPYDTELQRLAEILGALHYLRAALPARGLRRQRRPKMAQ